MASKASFPVFNGYAPKEGSKALPVNFNFTSVPSMYFDLLQENTDGTLQFVQSVYVDNSANNSPLTFMFGQTQQRLVIPARSQGIWPVICPDQVQVPVSIPAADETAIGSFIFMNVPMPTTQWGPITVNSINNVNVSSINKGRTDNKSTTIVATSVSQQLMLQNLNRLGMVIENPTGAATPIYIDFGTAATVANGYMLAPGQSYICFGPTVQTDTVHVLGTIGQTVIAKEIVAVYPSIPSVTYVTNANFDASVLPVTIPSIAIGSAAASRVIVANITLGSGSVDITSVTIGGIAAAVYYFGTQFVVAIASVPTGTTAAVVINGLTPFTTSVIAIYSVYDLQSTIPVDTDFGVSGISFVRTLDTLDGGVYFGFASGAVGSTGPMTFSIAAADYNVANGSRRLAGAYFVPTNGAPTACTITFNASNVLNTAGYMTFR